MNFEIFFGIIWELISFPILIGFIDSIASGEFALNFPLGFFALLFNGIGFGFLAVGIRKKIRDTSTNKYGEECYGRVIDARPNGTSINGRRQYDAEVELFVKSLNQIIKAKEVSGLGSSDYKTGDYVKVKYFNGDINFIEKVYPDYLPVDAQQALKNVQVNIENYGPTAPQIIYESIDIIQVDGVRYKRI